MEGIVNQNEGSQRENENVEVLAWVEEARAIWAELGKFNQAGVVVGAKALNQVENLAKRLDEIRRNLPHSVLLDNGLHSFSLAEAANDPSYKINQTA